MALSRHHSKLASAACCYNVGGNMTVEAKIRKIGNSLGIILPKEVLQQLNAGEGMSLYLTESPDGAVRVSRQDPDFAEKARMADDIIQRYPNALSELAK